MEMTVDEIRYNVSMERKRRKKSTSSRRKKEAAPRKDSTEVTFKAFFSWCVITERLGKHQEAEILAFFRAHRLRDKEDKDKYLKVLEKY